MLTRVILAAGVAALAIATPANAQKAHGGGGGHGGGPPAAAHGGGGGGGPHGGGGGPHGGGAPVFAGGGGGRGHGGGGGAPMFMGGGGGRGHGGGGFAAPRMQAQRQQFRGFQRQQSYGFARQQARGMAHQQSRGFTRQQGHAFARQQAHGMGHQQARMAGRQQFHGHGNQARFAARQQVHGNGNRAQMAARQQLHGNGNRAQFAQQLHGNGNRAQLAQQQSFANAPINARQFGNQGRQGAQLAGRQPIGQNYAGPAYSTLSYGRNVQVLPAPQVERYVGSPVAVVQGLSPIPASFGYLYPDTADYYYRYGDGYLYQVDRTDNLIAGVISLLAGGYLPGQYLPAAYMDSYVPAYYGFNSFYPDYGDTCNRYYDGVIYQVDCASGYVENVIPMYAAGYGVGQILPSAYSYYNVPYQYRNYYYNTADYGYWYAPGAIYQYDPRSSVITSVAALLSPGFTIGQPLPVGYDVYNVPYAYRATYYDTPSAWYRYSNGYIYQVDPATQLVTAIVASLLT